MKSTAGIIASLALTAAAVEFKESKLRQLLKRELVCTADSFDSDCFGEGIEYYQEVCLPSANNSLDLNAPCNALIAVGGQCLFGSEALPLLQGQASTLDSELSSLDYSNILTSLEKLEQNATVQRNCICESQFFSQIKGCEACLEKHGALSAVYQAIGTSIPIDSDVASLSSAYCAVTATPTGLIEYLVAQTDAPQFSSLVNQLENFSSLASPVTVSDPIGNGTAVSLYFTPSVTGSAAYVVAQPTGSAVTSNGQVVATDASGHAASAPSSASGSHAPSSTGNAGNKVAVAGGAVMAFAGLVAML